MSYHDYQDAQDKQLTRYQLVPRYKWRMLPNYWIFHNRNVQTSGYYHNTNGRNLGPVWKTQSFLLSEICTVILLQDCRGKGNSRKLCWSNGWEKVPDREWWLVHREKGLFLSLYVDDIKFAGKKHNIDPMWNVLMKQVDFGDPTSFLDHVYLGCTQRDCKISKDIVDNDRTMVESTISAGATEKLPCSENLNISSWSYDMQGDVKKCVERYCKLANKTTQHLHKVSTPCLDDHQFKEEELNSQGKLSKVCSQIVLKCQYLARIGSPDILWSVTKLVCDHKIDQNLWQTFRSSDLSHALHEWI